MLKELASRAAAVAAAEEGRPPPDSQLQVFSLDRRCRRLCCPSRALFRNARAGFDFVTRWTQSCASCPASGLPSVSSLVRHAARGTTESVSLRLANTLKLRCPMIGSFVCSSATRSTLPFLPISLAIASTRVASFELWRACGFCCCLVSANSERGIPPSAVSRELQGVMVEARVHTPPPQPSAKYSSQRSFPKTLGDSMLAQDIRFIRQERCSVYIVVRSRFRRVLAGRRRSLPTGAQRHSTSHRPP